jgi:hypothetical protein|tara:strand:- start:378 stop:728 length:351 start_codon:yes stop_codon:yes gene_type:complete
MRSLLFTLWIQADKSVSTIVTLLEQLTVAQVETVQQGGARMVNASLSGKSFSYELPANWGAFDFCEHIRMAYKTIETGGATGGQMTEAELKTYVLDTNDEVTDTMTARINYNSLRR